ncbi:hypothetical protein CSOJ01_14250 [Colletotrichum sojae]|uniref:Uncharacterized protein n=1 Tax=Colletotrichum sojae TaxID=2175907 RepID=A0A8H6MKC4_9PEZI|nr:hypothetical protein CSOJ01_14250 [Colletotrichum sojae]
MMTHEREVLPRTNFEMSDRRATVPVNDLKQADRLNNLQLSATAPARALHRLQYAEMLEYAPFVDCMDSFTPHGEEIIPPYAVCCDVTFSRLI